MGSASPYLIFCVAVACASTASFGVHSGIINQPRNAITFCNNLDDQNSQLNKCIEMNDWSWGVFVSIFLLGGILGGLSGGYLGTKLGRRRALLYNNFFYLSGTAFLTLGNNVNQLCLGRFLVGIGAGTSSVVVQLYVNEIAPISLRGTLGTCNQLSIVLGIAVSQLVGIPLSTSALWRFLFACSCIVPLLQCILLPFCVETPKWLSSQGLVSDAKKSLQRLRGMDGIDEELTDILNAPCQSSTDDIFSPPGSPPPDPEIEDYYDDGNGADEEDEGVRSASRNAARSQSKESHITVFNLFKLKPLRMPLIAAFGCQVAQQFSGINAAIYYSTTIFQQSYDSQTALLLTMIVSLVNIMMTLLSLVLIDKRGRKSLLITSQLIMAGNALGLATCFNLNVSPAIIVWLLMQFVGGFAIGLGPIPWMILPELIPSHAVGPAASVCTAINWASSFAVALVLPSAISFAGYNVFFAFGGLLMLFVVFTVSMLPESKGKKPEALLSYYKRDFVARLIS